MCDRKSGNGEKSLFRDFLFSERYVKVYQAGIQKAFIIAGSKKTGRYAGDGFPGSETALDGRDE